MEIKWSNVIAFALAIFSVVLAVRHRRDVGAALAVVGDIGPGHTPDEQVRGLCVLGVLAVATVAIVRLVLQGNERKDK